MNDVDVALQLAVGFEQNQMADSAEYFIENYVYIEDKDSPEGIQLFNMWDGQKEALGGFLLHRLSVILKARQLGLTWLALAYAVWNMVFRAGYTVVSMSRRDEDAIELVRRVTLILRYLPSWLINHKKSCPPGWTGLSWDATAHNVTITHPGKESSRFEAMPAAQDSGRSFTANLVILDEWAFQQWASEIWAAAYPTINRPTGGQVIGLSTAKRGTLFEEIVEAARRGENGFHFIFLPWYTDPRRTQEWYESTKLALPNSYRAEYPATPEEAFTVGEGAFFPEWDERFHIIQDKLFYPPKEWERVLVYDYGYQTRACAKWYAIDPDGGAVCYREYYPKQVAPEEQINEIYRLAKHTDGTQEFPKYAVADTQIWGLRSATGETIAETFMRIWGQLKWNIPLLKSDKTQPSGWARLHQWLFLRDHHTGLRPLLRFSYGCVHTAQTYPACIQSRTNPEDIDKRCEDHPQDCDRYFVMSRPLVDLVSPFRPEKRPVAPLMENNLPFALQRDEEVVTDWQYV